MVQMQMTILFLMVQMQQVLMLVSHYLLIQLLQQTIHTELQTTDCSWRRILLVHQREVRYKEYSYQMVDFIFQIYRLLLLQVQVVQVQLLLH